MILSMIHKIMRYEENSAIKTARILIDKIASLVAVEKPESFFRLSWLGKSTWILMNLVL